MRASVRVTGAEPPSSGRRLDFARKTGYGMPIHQTGNRPMLEDTMAHKKIERKKELDRRRHRRAQRLKQRVREAKAAAKN